LPNPGHDPDRYIIAAVDNDSPPFVARAGGSPQGYDVVRSYGPAPQPVRRMQSLEADYGLHEVSAWPIGPLKLHCAVLEIPAEADRGRLIAELAKDRRVRLVQPLQTFTTSTEPYNDPYVKLQQGFQQMAIAQAQSWSQGAGIKIAIIDTGADTLHPDLARHIIAAQNFVDADSVEFRKDRHGTEMAGVIGAIAHNGEGIVGVAPESRLLIFKACWQARADADAASCNSFTLARALSAALEARVQIVNLSLSGPADPLLMELIQEGARRGIVFVGAVSPLMNQPGVIEVTRRDSPVPGDAAPLRAPGTEILTTLPGGRYDFATGDSISTAQVSGVVALMLAKNRVLSTSAIYGLLRRTSAAEGARQVDACAAMVALLERGSCSSSADR
jgi:subtilisin family serine protease